MKKIAQNKGFTLIEILVVIGIIAILATIVIVAINPARQFAQARNTQRVSNVNSILNAIGQRLADNKGVFNGGTPNCQAIPSAATSTIYNGGVIPAGNNVDLSCLTPTYIPSFPSDPTHGSANNTGYEVRTDSNGRVTVCVPTTNEELGTPICVIR